MTERETGEFIATQKLIVLQIAALEEAVDKLGKKVTLGKGFIAGAAVASGGGWAIITSVISKIGGGP